MVLDTILLISMYSRCNTHRDDNAGSGTYGTLCRQSNIYFYKNIEAPHKRRAYGYQLIFNLCSFQLNVALH